MCRYAEKTYKPHFVCFDCRKTFKQPVVEDMVMQNGEWDLYKQAYLNYNSESSTRFRNENPDLIKYFEERYRNKKYLCPDCGSIMNNIGLDFKAPKKDRKKEWEIIRSLYSLGNTFHTCGCDGPGYIPKNQKDYLIYLEEIRSGYQERLSTRDEDNSDKSLTEYIDYWSSKLNAISREIERIKAGNKVYSA